MITIIEVKEDLSKFFMEKKEIKEITHFCEKDTIYKIDESFLVWCYIVHMLKLEW